MKRYCKKCEKETVRYSRGQCAPCRISISARYYGENGQHVRARKRERYADCTLPHKATARAYYLANREAIKARSKAYYQQNSTKILARLQAKRDAEKLRRLESEG